MYQFCRIVNGIYLRYVFVKHVIHFLKIYIMCAKTVIQITIEIIHIEDDRVHLAVLCTIPSNHSLFSLTRTLHIKEILKCLLDNICLDIVTVDVRIIICSHPHTVLIGSAK